MWKETNFSAQGWAKGLRSLVPFSFQGVHTVKHGRANMELTAATSAVANSLGVEDAQFLFTVCLDHRLRIWNVRTGAILFTADMLGVERNPQELGKWVLDPTRDNLIRIVGQLDGVRTLVAYSPAENEFKFWKVEAKDDSSLYVHDMYADHRLIPPPPSSGDVWTLADFGVAQPTGAAIHLWVLWKNNLTYRVLRVDLTSSQPADTAAEWDKNQWSSVQADNAPAHVDAASSEDPTDATEKWLQAIFYPGRFSQATLEAALAMYERGLGTRETSAKNGKGLAESICSVLGYTVTLSKLSAGEMDYEQFRAHGEVQWRRFHRLVMELDKQRGEALSLALDHNSGVAWVLCADLVAIMHRCSDLEQIYYNPHADKAAADDVTSLLSAGLGLVENFSDSIMQQSNAALRIELFEESAKTDMDRIQHFFDESGFWRGISEEDAAQVVETLGTDFKIVTPALYRGLIELFETNEDDGGSDDPHPLTEFGRKVVVKSVQETAGMQWQILLSQLLLLVHMEYEYDEDGDENALHSRLDIGHVYRQIIEALQRLELVRWLVKTEITVPLLKSERSSGSPITSKRPEETLTITAFEAFISHLLGLEDVDGEPLASSLTNVVIDVCAPNSGIELSPTLIQCSLLKRDRPHLALELSPFCNQDPFSVYIQGRVLLSLKDYASAAVYFKKAAVGMSKPLDRPDVQIAFSQPPPGVSMTNSDLRTGGLLDETEKKLINSGPANYYAHIVSLYDRHRAFSYVIDFARLSLQFAHAEDAQITRKEMSSRLFAAATSISRFEMAHATLLMMDDRALQHSCLKRLVERMCETSQTSELIALPFPGLQEEVDDILFQKCKSTMEVTRGTPYHKILYAWRITHNDYRGATAVLHDRLQKLRQAGEGDNLGGADVLDTAVTKQFLLLINALSCVDPKQAYITVEEVADDSMHEKGPKRKVVTLAELRKQYQAELDRIAAIQNNQFGLGAEDDVMVIDQ